MGLMVPKVVSSSPQKAAELQSTLLGATECPCSVPVHACTARRRQGTPPISVTEQESQNRVPTGWPMQETLCFHLISEHPRSHHCRGYVPGCMQGQSGMH